MLDDRWWRDFDTVILDAVPAGARVLDVGCGDGSLVERLTANGLEAFGVDPRAPARPWLLQERVERVAAVRPFDAVCAVMSLHHADLQPVLAAITRLLRPGGRLFACEFAWEAYDERASSWVTARDPSGAENSVDGWRTEHADHHTSDTMSEALSVAFDLHPITLRPYLARMLRAPELEPQEEAMIVDGELPALGRWYFAERR